MAGTLPPSLLVNGDHCKQQHMKHSATDTAHEQVKKQLASLEQKGRVYQLLSGAGLFEMRGTKTDWKLHSLSRACRLLLCQV